jgi:hypothetical protein
MNRRFSFAVAVVASAFFGPAAMAVTPEATPTATEIAAPKPQALRTRAVSRSGDTVSAVVAVPTLLSARPVPAKSFTVTDRGSVLPARVTRLPIAGVELTVLVDVPATDAATLPAVHGAIADFLYHLPRGVRVAVVPAGALRAPTPVADLKATLAALRDTRPQRASLMGAAISRVIVDVADRTGTRSAVVVVSGRSRGFLPGIARVAPGQPTVYALVPPAGRRSAASVAAFQSVGTTTTWRTAEELLAGLDDVAADLGGQYRVDFAAPADVNSVDVTVDFAGIPASSRVRIPAVAVDEAEPSSAGPAQRAPVAKVPRASGKGVGSIVKVGLLVLVGWFVIVGLVALLVQQARWRRGRQLVLPAGVDGQRVAPEVIDLTDGSREQSRDVPSQSHPSGE